MGDDLSNSLELSREELIEQINNKDFNLSLENEIFLRKSFLRNNFLYKR